MKRIGIMTHIWGLLALALGAAVIAAALLCRDARPVLLCAPPEAREQVVQLMDAVCRGDFSGAEQLLYGAPDLGMDREPADPVGAMVWQTYVGSLDYQLLGEVYATDTGLAQDVKIIHIELDTATEHLGRRARELLEQAIARAEDVSELYDENNAFRQELVQQVLQQAAREALEADVRYTYDVVSLQLVCSDGSWQPLADGVFLRAISGGTAG